MREKVSPTLAVRVFTEPRFVPAATSFVEKASLGLGLAQAEATALTLATEEIFSYLCGVPSPDQAVEIRCSSGRYYVRVEFLFSAREFDMGAFNLTATVAVDDEKSLGEMGLLIASRLVDRFHVSEVGAQGLRLSLTKEKAYPAATAQSGPAARLMAPLFIREPAPEELKLFALLAWQRYPRESVPDAFRFPGKVVDMVAGGEYQASLALDRGGRIGGGIVWHWAGLKTVECLGPFIFHDDTASSTAEALLESCLGAIAKTPAVGLISRRPTGDLPRDHFEPLGTLTILDPSGSRTEMVALYRQMHEDLGASVWVHPALEPFLRAEHQRLVLPREMRQVQDLGEARGSSSVLSAEFDRAQGVVTLRPIRDGADAKENVKNHLEVLAREALRGVFFEMDLGVPWQAHFTPALLDNGFEPRLLLPYAGTADLVIFQWRHTGR